jgi:hypothetical protein
MIGASVRGRLLNALRLDLIGPRPGDVAHVAYAEEILPLPPSRWYLTGFLVPYETPPEQRSDEEGDDALDEVDRPVEGDDDNAPEATSARKAFFPSSMGLSVLLPRKTTELQVRVSWGDYGTVVDEGVEQIDGEDPPAEQSEGGEATGKADRCTRPRGWRRLPREAESVLALREGDPVSSTVPGSEARAASAAG